MLKHTPYTPHTTCKHTHTQTNIIKYIYTLKHGQTHAFAHKYSSAFLDCAKGQT